VQVAKCLHSLLVEVRDLREELAFGIPAGNLNRLGGRIVHGHGGALHGHILVLLLAIPSVELSILRAKAGG